MEILTAILKLSGVSEPKTQICNIKIEFNLSALGYET